MQQMQSKSSVEEDKYDDNMDQIPSSSSNMNNQIEEQPAQKFDADNMEAFMDFGERERAATYYKQM